MQPMQSLIDALGDMPVITQPQRIRQRSRDFYWYSPILRERLAEVTADLVVCPRDEADVIRTLAVCHARQVPVTPRGAGTGNYGQAMPLEGGVVLDLSDMNEVLAIDLGRLRAQAGAVLADIDRACQGDSRQELRFHPSTWATATIGGFVAGGSSGVGSITWGLLRDPGNILGLRVVTMQAQPLVLELRRDDIQKVNHAYGTTGVITEVLMPLAPAYPWHEAIVAWPDLTTACRFAQRLAEQDALVKKLVTVIGQPIARQYFPAFEGIVPADRDLVMVMIADNALDAFMAMVRAEGGRRGCCRCSSTAGTTRPCTR
jgi:FAD/FMN-containing dehydrogenase